MPPTNPIAALRTSLAKARDYTEDSYRSRADEAAAWADVDAKVAEVEAELEGQRTYIANLRERIGLEPDE